MIYLDYAASSPPFLQAIDEMRTVAVAQFGNPGSIHKLGPRPAKFCKTAASSSQD